MSVIGEVASFFSAIGFNENAIPLALATALIIYVFRERLHKSLAPIKNAIIEIQTLITSKGAVLNHLLTERGRSPLEPTDYGIELIEQSGLKEAIHKNKKKLFSDLSKKLKNIGSVSAYDVQEYAREVLIENKNSSFMAPIKEYAFQNAMNVDIILRTGGLTLRDLFLKEHKLNTK